MKVNIFNYRKVIKELRKQIDNSNNINADLQSKLSICSEHGEGEIEELKSALLECQGDDTKFSKTAFQKLVEKNEELEKELELSKTRLAFKKKLVDGFRKEVKRLENSENTEKELNSFEPVLIKAARRIYSEISKNFPDFVREDGIYLDIMTDENTVGKLIFKKIVRSNVQKTNQAQVKTRTTKK